MTMTIMDTAAEASVRPVPAHPGAMLHAAVADLLDELGRQPAAVAAAELAADGHRGVPGTVMHPVARWLVAQLAGPQAPADGPTAWVLPDGLYVILDAVAALVPLPAAVAELATDFDLGHYPELVMTPPPPDPPPALVAPAADAGLGWPVVHLGPPEDGLTHCTECYCTEITSCEGGCQWAGDDDVLAAGLDPAEFGVVCTACLDMLAAAADALARTHAEAALPPAPDPAEDHEDEAPPAAGRATPAGSHTAQLPIVRDAGRVLVRVALLLGVAALAVAVAVTGRPVSGAVLALLLAGVELVLAVRRRAGERPPGRHRTPGTSAYRTVARA